MKKSIDLKAAQCYISLDQKDHVILEDSANFRIFDKNKFISFYLNQGKFTAYEPSEVKKINCYSLSCHHDIPIYLNKVESDIEMENLLLNFSFIKRNFSPMFITVFNIGSVWYVKYCLDLVLNVPNDFPICTRLNRYIDLKMIQKLNDLPKLFSENKEILASIQIILELKYSLDSLWERSQRDTLREWSLHNWIVELTLTIRRKYRVDLTNYLEPKYFGYPQAESVQINKELTSLVVSQKSNTDNVPYIDFLQEQGILNA